VQYQLDLVRLVFQYASHPLTPFVTESGQAETFLG